MTNKWLLNILLFVFLALSQRLGLATMYVWVEPATGTTRYSSDPPSWYKNPESRIGNESTPRVRVYKNGVLVDDTGAPRTNKEVKRGDSKSRRQGTPGYVIVKESPFAIWSPNGTMTSDDFKRINPEYVAELKRHRNTFRSGNATTGGPLVTFEGYNCGVSSSPVASDPNKHRLANSMGNYVAATSRLNACKQNIVAAIDVELDKYDPEGAEERRMERIVGKEVRRAIAKQPRPNTAPNLLRQEQEKQQRKIEIKDAIRECSRGLCY